MLDIFLQEVFCINSLSEVHDLDTLFILEESCLDYKMLYLHPRFKIVFLGIHVFKHTFGFFPSFSFIYTISKDLNSFESSIAILCHRLQTETFLNHVQHINHASLLKAFQMAKDTIISIINVHNFEKFKSMTLEWLSRDDPNNLLSGAECTLYSAFKKIATRKWINKPLNIASFPDLSVDVLDYKEVHVQCHYRYDAKAHFMIMNKNIFRFVFGHVLIMIDHDADIQIVSKIVLMIASVFDKERLVIASSICIANALRSLPVNLQFVPLEFIPANCATLCFHVTSDFHKHFHLGITSVYRIVLCKLPVTNIQPMLTDLVILQSTENIKSTVTKLLPKPCIPICFPQAICNAYFQIYLDLLKSKDIKSAINSRCCLYASLIPTLLELEFAKGIDTISNQAPRCSAKYAVLLIDTRRNNLSLISMLVTWANIVQHEAFDLVVVTTRNNYDHYKSIVSHVRFLHLDSIEKTPFDLDAYNDLLKTPPIWKHLADMGYSKCLIIQDDGMLVRKGLEDSMFMQQDFTYVGAPWTPCEENKEVILLTRNNLVGNGGFSLRSVSEMLRTTCNHQAYSHALFNNRLQPVQEDVFFSTFASKVPTFQEALDFSTEQCTNANAYGFHKPWMYQSYDQIRQLALKIIERSISS